MTGRRNGRISRRGFLGRTIGCAAWLAGGFPPGSPHATGAFAGTAARPVVAEEDFARIERIADGVWAVVSTPLKNGGQHFATTANGGIVAGRDGVLVIEGYYTDEGAAWLAGQVRSLTGREPTHVVVTHFHADHTRGLGGLGAGRPAGAEPLETWATPTTRARLVEDDEPVLPDARIDDEDGGAEIDLGGRSLRLVPLSGHTASDVAIELDGPDVVWCGDLVWNGMFPNYVDAIPSALTRSCEALLGRRGTTYVPGHGDVADGDSKALASYRGLVLDLERAGRRAVESGTPPEQAAKTYRLPESIESWVMFSPTYVERAFTAWHRELTGATTRK